MSKFTTPCLLSFYAASAIAAGSAIILPASAQTTSPWFDSQPFGPELHKTLPKNPGRPVQNQPQSQSSTPPTSQSFDLSPEFRNRAYRLGAGDQISIQVQRFPDLSFNGPINPEGNVIIPLIGNVSLRNLTIQQAQQRLSDRLNQFIKNPAITISLLVQRPVQVTVTGEVARPGFYPLQVPQISAALSAANGTTSNADLRAVRVRRTLADGSIVEQIVDLLTPLKTGSQPPNLRLEDGDAVIVPYQEVQANRQADRDLAAKYSLAAAQTPVQVTVAGEVSKPGFYTLPAGSGQISAALTAAGGVTLRSDLRAVRLRRSLVNGSIIEEAIDLYTPLANATEFFDLPLENGDAIIVPTLQVGQEQNYDRNLVARSTLVKPRIYVRVLNYAKGQLNSFYLENGSTFLDAIGGVPVDIADLRKIGLIRYDPQQQRAFSREINAQAALGGDVSQNPLLQDNDVIIIGRNFVARLSFAIRTYTQPLRDVVQVLLLIQQFLGGVNRVLIPLESGGSGSSK